MNVKTICFLKIEIFDDIDFTWVNEGEGEKFGYHESRDPLYAAVSKEIGLDFTIPADIIKKVWPEGEKRYTICKLETLNPEKYISQNRNNNLARV